TLDENGLILIKRIYHLCGFYEESKNNFPEILKNLKLMPLCSLLFTVTPLNLNNAVRASILGTYIATLPIPTRHQVLLDSLSLFEDFPNNFFVFLTSLKNIYSYRVSEKIKHVSTARIIIYNTITRCIRKTLTDPEFDFVRDAYQEYLLRERLDSYGLVIDYSQHHSAKIFLERHMRLDEARSKLGVTAVAVLEMMKIGTIRFCETKSKIERYYLNREDVEATAKRLKTCISIPQASQILGVEAFHLNRLINDGYLHLIEDLRITPVYSRVLDKREVNNLFDTFRNAMLNSPFYKKKNLNTLNFRQTALWLGILKINFSGMYKLIKSGDLTPVDYNPSEKGVMGFVYLKSEVDKIYKDYMKAEFSNTYGSKELVKILKINTTIFSKVVKKNYLKFFESGTFLRIRFTKKSFENFQKKYIFTNELSAKFSTSNEYVNKKLAEMKVYPVDNSLSKHIHLYLRKNVKNLIIQKSQMVLEQSRKNRLAQKLTIQQAAHELNLSEEEILMAVDHKLLPPIKKTEHGILFSPLRIATFKSWNLPHMNFLRTRAAAKFMNCSLNKFKSNYEFTGKITPEIRKYKNKSVYKFYDLNVLKTLQD
nr:hypothetical protein [Pyrinomonadaceae bacterium]